MKESITKFDLEAAFKALDKIDPPIVEKGIKANKPALTEIFSRKSKFDSLFEEYYDIGNSNELEDAKDAREAEIALAKLDRIEKIVDLDAKSPEDLLTSYVGKYIIQCPQCLTLFYKNPEDVEESEDDSTLVNVNEVCQHCGNESGYTLVGKVGEAEAGEFNDPEVSLDEEPAEATEENTSELPEEDLDLELDDEELEELDIDIEDDEEVDSEENTKEESFSLQTSTNNILTEKLNEATELDVSADEFEKLISSTEFKKPIADSEVRGMMQELTKKEQEVSEATKMDKENTNKLTEGVGAETANALKDVLSTINKEESKQGWTDTVANIIELIPDELIDDLFDAAKDKLSNVKLNDDTKKKIIDLAGDKLDREEAEDADTLGKILSLFDITSWDATNLKKYLIAVLGIIAVIEPTPILEIITGIVAILPADIVKKILTITNISNIVGVTGTVINKGYQLLRNLLKEDLEDNLEASKNSDLDEGIFDKVKNKFTSTFNKITDSLKSREDKANWILENTAENYDEVKLDTKSGKTILDKNNKKFNNFIVIGFEENYSSGRPITTVPSFDNKDLVIGRKPEAKKTYQEAESLAKGWSMRQGNGPAFIYLAKGLNDPKAVFLCTYFEGELANDQLENYLKAVKQDLESVKLMAGSNSSQKDSSSASNESLNTFIKNVEDLQEATLEQQISDSLIEAYQNVASYRLTNCSYLNEVFKIEGKVLFTSGNTRNITYSFTEAYLDENNKVKLYGLNEKLGPNKQFTITGYADNKTFITESFKSNIK